MTREEAIFCEKSYIGETNCTDCKYYGTETCQSRESHRMAIKALEQEPFINKPCVSSGACEHDKNKVLETIRAELHATAEMHEDGDYYLRDEWIDEYFDKYKAEFEPQESERDA